MKKTATTRKKKPTSKKMVEENSFTIVAIGASAGGLDAVSILLKNLSPTTGMAFIYVQHLNPDHKSTLPSILAKTTKMKVQEIEDMEHMVPNNIYVIPHNKIIEVTDGHIKLLPRPKNSSIISIDVLFSSLAETHKKNVIGVILSGYAKDGTKGMKAIKAAGGVTIAQDNSAQASSMPQSAITSGVIDFILSPKKIALKLEYFGKNGLKHTANEKQKIEVIENSDSDLKTIFELLHKETGVDFSHYKMPTIKRRLSHKMIQCGVKTTNDYVKLLRKKNKEIDLLYNSLLINVTNFFREKETFTFLKNTLFPKILQSKKPNETFRIWIPACSSGEEAYSIAILISELQSKKNKKIPVQIFATDISEKAIGAARIGEYSETDIKNVSKNHKERFFNKIGDSYRVIKEIREMCVFAPHNILRDPPFSRMDFISCCNLLIYFDTPAQKKVFATVHFSLNENGYFMLGKAESTGTSSQLFSKVNTKFKIYSRKEITGTPKFLELTPQFTHTNTANKKTNFPSKNINPNPTRIESAIDSALLSHYMPACVVVNKDMEILQFRGPVSLYLLHSSGKASLNILKMSRPEFAFELRSALNESIKTKQCIYKSGIELQVESTFRKMSLEVSPLKIDWEEPFFIIVFTLQEKADKHFTNIRGSKNIETQKDQRIKRLTMELSNTRAEMNSIIESQETTYEELQAANEEIVSTNEEFQTLNEELETSKEEIQANNEELLSANHELLMRNELLAESNEYTDAIISTIHEPMLVLNKDFTIKSANRSFYQKFQTKKEDTEGKSFYELGNKQWNLPKLRKILNEVFSKNSSFENFEVLNTFPIIGEKIMLLNAHLIIQSNKREQLILLAIADVTEVRKLALELLKRKSTEELRLVNDELAFQNKEKEKRLTELIIANKELAFQSEEKKKRADELIIANKELIYQTGEKEKRAAELAIAEIERAFQNKEKEKWQIANKELEEAKNKAEKATLIAENAVKSKQQFLSNMSHEIRTPMNAIIGFTKIVLRTALNPKQKEYLIAIQTSGDALIVLINDILDLAKVNAGKMTFEQTPFKMALSLSSILHLFEAKIHEKNLELISEYDSNIPEVLIGDPVRLHQIILNLVSNAIKFTAKGKITVTVILLNEDADQVTIEFKVSDTGIGIAADKLDSIFENFQQASSGTSRLYGGTGLGLAIVKQLVEPQGGSILVTSKIDEGSTFSFTLSFQKTTVENITHNNPEEKEVQNAEIKKIKVLVVEDVALNQLLIKTLLDDFGFERDIASNGKVAINKMHNNTYDIILMDIQMPEMNGFEATEYIRNTLNSKIPIIALTADVTTVDIDKCIAVGMNDYVAKPIDEKLLYNKIIELVKKLTF